MPYCFCFGCNKTDAFIRIPFHDEELAKTWVRLAGRLWEHVTVNHRFCYRHFPPGSKLPTIQFHKNASPATAHRKEPHPRNREEYGDKENIPVFATWDDAGKIVFSRKY